MGVSAFGWPDVALVEDGVTSFSASDMNPIIQGLKDRTEALLNITTSLQGSYGATLTIPGSAFSAECRKGTILAVDEHGMYVPAVAQWSNYSGRNGCNIPHRSSYVVGVLLSDVAADGNGLVLCDGWITDQEITQILTSNAQEMENHLSDDVGGYYLSTTAPGTTVRGVPDDLAIVVYCFTARRDSSGNLTVIFKPSSPEYAGHSHEYIELNPSLMSRWSPIESDSNTQAFPQDASWKLGLYSTDKEYNQITSNSVVLKNGAQLPRSSWGILGISDVKYLYTTFEVLPDSDSFTICNVTPFTAREPVVRSLNFKGNPGLFTVDGAYGNLSLSLNPAAVSSGKYTGKAVLDISESGMQTGSVVHEVYAGPGIITKSGKLPGTVIVSNSAIAGTLIDLMLCNLDGVVLGSGDVFTSYVFPAGVNSRLFGTLRIPNASLDEDFKIRLALTVRGCESGFPLTVRCRQLRRPVGTEAEPGSVAIPTSPIVLSLSQDTAGSDKNTAYELCTAPFEVSANSLIMCEVQATSPVTHLEVFSIAAEII